MRPLLGMLYTAKAAIPKAQNDETARHLAWTRAWLCVDIRTFELAESCTVNPTPPPPTMQEGVLILLAVGCAAYWLRLKVTLHLPLISLHVMELGELIAAFEYSPSCEMIMNVPGSLGMGCMLLL